MKNKHTPTKAMQSAAKRGVTMAKDNEHDDLALAAGKKVAAGQALSDEHVHAMAAHHADHPGDCPGDVNDLLWGGPAGALWSVARSSVISASNPDSESKLSELLEDPDRSISFEIFSEDNLGEPTSLGEDENGWIWSPILRSGMTMTRPGPNGEKLNEPLVFVPGNSEDQHEAIGLKDILDAFNDAAVQHVTLPTTHDNNLLDNTGFIKGLKIVDSKKCPGEMVLVGGHNFTEPDILGKVKRGTIANRSCGLLYDYTNPTSGKTYPIVLEHVALTNQPWVHGMTPYGELNDADLSEREVIAMCLSEQVKAPAPSRERTVQGLRFDTKDAVSTKQTTEELAKQLGLADVQWSTDEISLNSIRSQLVEALNKLRAMGGDDNLHGPPYYYVRDCTQEKALVSIDYGGSDPDDAWVVPFALDDSGALTLSPYADWTPVEQQWVTDEDAAQDKSELEAIIGAALSAEELEANLKLSETDLQLATLTAKKRNDLPDSSFVYPKDKRYPIHDLAHAKNALARSSGKPEEATVKTAVHKKYPQLKPDSSSKMSELPDDPLKRASVRRLGETQPQNNVNPGGTMRLSEEQMERLGLSDEAKQLIRKQNEELAEKDQRLTEATQTNRKATVDARIAKLAENPLFKGYPGFLREVEAAMLSDDGDVAVKLQLSDGVGGSVSTPHTVTQLCERLLTALSVPAEQAAAVTPPGTLLESPIAGRPPVEPENPADRKPKTGDELLAEWAAADPSAVASLSSPENTGKAAS